VKLEKDQVNKVGGEIRLGNADELTISVFTDGFLRSSYTNVHWEYQYTRERLQRCFWKVLKHESFILLSPPEQAEKPGFCSTVFRKSYSWNVYQNARLAVGVKGSNDEGKSSRRGHRRTDWRARTKIRVAR